MKEGFNLVPEDAMGNPTIDLVPQYDLDVGVDTQGFTHVTVKAKGAKKWKWALFQVFFDETKYEPVRMDYGNWLDGDEEGTLKWCLLTQPGFVPVVISKIHYPNKQAKDGYGDLCVLTFDESGSKSTSDYSQYFNEVTPSTVDPSSIKILDDFDRRYLVWTEANWGDGNLNGWVEDGDVNILSIHYNQHPSYDPNAPFSLTKLQIWDYNHDGEIEITDIEVVSQNYHKGVNGYRVETSGDGIQGHKTYLSDVVNSNTVRHTIFDPDKEQTDPEDERNETPPVDLTQFFDFGHRIAWLTSSWPYPNLQTCTYLYRASNGGIGYKMQLYTKESDGSSRQATCTPAKTFPPSHYALLYGTPSQAADVGRIGPMMPPASDINLATMELNHPDGVYTVGEPVRATFYVNGNREDITDITARLRYDGTYLYLRDQPGGNEISFGETRWFYLNSFRDPSRGFADDRRGAYDAILDVYPQYTAGKAVFESSGASSFADLTFAWSLTNLGVMYPPLVDLSPGLGALTPPSATGRVFTVVFKTYNVTHAPVTTFIGLEFRDGIGERTYYDNCVNHLVHQVPFDNTPDVVVGAIVINPLH